MRSRGVHCMREVELRIYQRPVQVKDEKVHALRQGPAFAEYGLQVLIGLRMIRKTHLGGVPLELSFDSQSDNAQQHPFHERGRHVEIRRGRVSSLAGSDPIAIVTGRTGEQRRPYFVVLHPLNRKQSGLFAVGARRKDAFIPDKDAPVRRRNTRFRILLTAR